MSQADFELAIQRQNTRWFIDQDPTVLVLIPEIVVTAGGSKRTEDGTARDPQTFKFIYQSETQSFPLTEGNTKRTDFVLVGDYDAVVAVGDHWSEGKQTYRIHTVEPPNGYEVKAIGTTFGGSPNHG